MHLTSEALIYQQSAEYRKGTNILNSDNMPRPRSNLAVYLWPRLRETNVRPSLHKWKTTLIGFHTIGGMWLDHKPSLGEKLRWWLKIGKEANKWRKGTRRPDQFIEQDLFFGQIRRSCRNWYRNLPSGGGGETSKQHVRGQGVRQCGATHSPSAG